MKNELSDDELARAFASCTLRPNEFDHRAHVRIAWIYVRQMSIDDAIEQICTGIQRVATHLGAPDKFNRTMSEALVRWIATHAKPDIDFNTFIASHPQLLNDVRALLARHYSPERLTSSEAKRMFLAPDREPLPHAE